MFTVKLGTNQEFAATAVQETFLPKSAEEQRGYCLTIESTEMKYSLDWYREQLTAPGSLDIISVTAEQGSGVTLEGYTVIVNLSRRLMADGRSYLSILLEKEPEAREGTETV